MWKAIVAGTAALAIAGTSLAVAQQRGRDGGERARFSTEDLRAFGEARLAALKAGLTLNADQEKNWPAFEQAARDYAKLRRDRRAAMRNAVPGEDPVERLRQRATALSDAGAALKKLADATEPLYKSLDDSQKRRFAILGRLAGADRGFAGGGNREFRGRDGGWGPSERGGMREWAPRRMGGPKNSGQDLEHSGEQRL
jgi:zinc resistance-associated protein